MTPTRNLKWAGLFLAFGAAAWILFAPIGRETSSVPRGPRKIGRPRGASATVEPIPAPKSKDSGIPASPLEAGRAPLGQDLESAQEESGLLTVDQKKDMVLSLAPEYLAQVREYWLELRFDRRRWDQKLDDLERILQSPYFEKSANRFLRAEDFADLGTDGIQEVRGILGVQGESENSNVDGGPLEFTPEHHLASLSEGESWKEDPALLREVARLETRSLRAVARIAMEQNVLDDAVGMAIHALDFDSMDFGYGGRHRPAIHLNEWFSLEEAKQRIFSQYENWIRNALQIRGLLKESE